MVALAATVVQFSSRREAAGTGEEYLEEQDFGKKIAVTRQPGFGAMDNFDGLISGL